MSAKRENIMDGSFTAAPGRWSGALTLLPLPARAACMLAMIVGSSYASVPLPLGPVPMTMQSLAVLLAGIWGGPRLGAAVCVCYLALGLSGLPVFAGGAAAPGLALLARPSAGFLLAFAPAAFVSGWAYRSLAERPFLGALAALSLGHCVVFAGGLAWLTSTMTAAQAVAVGVIPFLAGTAVKIALGTALVGAVRARRPRVAA